LLCFEEPGINFKEDAINFVKSGGVTKALIAFVVGKFNKKIRISSALIVYL